MLSPLDVHQDQIMCPYNKVHLVERGRFQVHLSRCRKTVTNNPLVRCPFNAVHLVHDMEMNWHVQECPNRDTFENFRNTIATSTGCLPEPVEEMPTIETSENWDDDPPAQTYNARSYAENAPVLRNCQNAPPSVRKKFRKKEHRRLAGMDNN